MPRFLSVWWSVTRPKFRLDITGRKWCALLFQFPISILEWNQSWHALAGVLFSMSSCIFIVFWQCIKNNKYATWHSNNNKNSVMKSYETSTQTENHTPFPPLPKHWPKSRTKRNAEVSPTRIIPQNVEISPTRIIPQNAEVSPTRIIHQNAEVSLTRIIPQNVKVLPTRIIH